MKKNLRFMLFTIALCFFISTNKALATRIDLNQKDLSNIENFPEKQINCNNQQTIGLNQSANLVNQRLIDLKKNWINYNLESVKKNFVDPEGRVWNPLDPHIQIYQSYWQSMDNSTQKMIDDSNSGLNFQCSTNLDRNCPSGVFAYVLFFLGKPKKIIHLCPLYWEVGESQRSEILFHELSHYSASTEDLAGAWWRRGNIDLFSAAHDAYHFQEFYSNEPASILKRVVWSWWWPKKN